MGTRTGPFEALTVNASSPVPELMTRCSVSAVTVSTASKLLVRTVVSAPLVKGGHRIVGAGAVDGERIGAAHGIDFETADRTGNIREIENGVGARVGEGGGSCARGGCS